jgi:hypothetical protein
MSKFWDLLSQSVIVQGVVTIALVGACIYLSVIGQEIPEVLTNATMLALGFYFGSKSQQTINAYVKHK